DLPVHLYDVSTWATAQFAGALAEASLVLRPWEPEFALQLQQAAAAAWRWLAAHPERYPAGGFRNPDASGGPYCLPDRDEAEYRLWAAASLFHATGEAGYQQAFHALWRRPAARPVDGLYWWGGRLFAMQAYLDSAGAEPGRLAEIRDVMRAQAQVILGVTEATGYRVALTGAADEFGYDWGSNTIALGYAIYLLLVNAFAPDPRLTAGAAAQLDYVLGVNPLGKCYVSGLGADPVRRPHHRPSAALGQALPGLVTEGANAMNVGGDPVLQALFEAGLPGGQRYADEAGSWATNEATIYANAAFTAVAAWFTR
ncbi:MAG: glycoside hydrolase family 9 protein, partial [Anaerolineales bacterium]|nr:glycoside hydrolase family 9 protein [Anaerolineales bacterium]